MNRPRRKKNRLQDYGYSSCGGYFITFCTRNKEKLFWNASGISSAGKIVEQVIREIPERYPGVRLDHYVVMPNHVHLLLVIPTKDCTVSIATVVNQMKGAATKRIGMPVWQKLFHDRIIRNDREYQKIWSYIDTNPMRWEQDCFYCE